MENDLYYKLDRRRIGNAVIVNNLDKEQSPTRQDVERMSKVLQIIGELSFVLIINSLSSSRSAQVSSPI